MSFADELRQKAQQGESPMSEAEVERWARGYLQALRYKAGAYNRSGRRYVDGYLSYYGYDNDSCSIIENVDRIRTRLLDDRRIPLDRLRDRLYAGLKELGFDNVYVEVVSVPIYEMKSGMFGREVYKVRCMQKTIRVRFSW